MTSTEEQPRNEILANPVLTIVFALPGETYSRHFLLSWSNLLFELIKRNIKPVISQSYSSMVHFARMRTLGGDNLKGPNQKPFQNQVDYDYIMMIDSDIVFNASTFFDLLESNRDVVSVPYLMADTKHYAIVLDWNEQYFMKNGTFPFITPEELEKLPKIDNKFVKCNYTGLGFTLIKKGVIEKIKYPWFDQELQRMTNHEGHEIVDLCSEDVSFCKNLQKAGVDILIRSDLRVGHYKSFII